MVLPVCCQEKGSRRVIAAAVARLLGTNNIDPHAASLSGQRQLAAATRARDAVAGALDAVSGGVRAGCRIGLCGRCAGCPL
mgnify:CR=1 FL=1